MPAGETPVKIHSRLLASMRAGETLLTATQRPARELRHAFDQAMLAEGLPHWQPAKILAFDTWLDTLWRDLLLNGDETRLLLNRTQQHSLWRRIIAADAEIPGLRSADLLAEMAADAWSTVCLYEGRARLREFGISTDSKAFQRWAQEFERRCQRAVFLPSAQLAEALGQALAQGTLTHPATGLTLVDCDELPPAHATLLNQIERAGYPIQRASTALPSASALHTAPDDEQELRAAAHWCRERLELNPAARIAIVIPALAGRRFPLERALAQVLAPHTQPITATPAAPLVEFSLGLSLAQTPACAAALDLLRWALNPIPLATIASLLLSPFLVPANEALAAADFDVQTLRHAHLLRPELSLEAFLHLTGTPPTLATHLRALRRTAQAEKLSESRLHGDWAEVFRALLEAAGWTAATARSSQSRQTRRRWESLLDELATLDFEPARPTAAEALRELTRLAQQTIFAPETTHAPVQVLGPLELGGQPFDHLWLLGADDLAWPPAASPSPLIPWHLHQSLATPGADPTRDRHRDRRLTGRILTSATEVVASYAQHSGEGTRRPSPLVAHLPPADLATQPTPADPTPLLQHLDTLPVAPLPDSIIAGGASILQAQAACAFRAFAEKRLRSTAPETSETGLNPRDRGTLVHDVMEHFWSRLEDRQTLKNLSLQDRLAALDDAIDAALARTAARARVPWERAYVEVQRQRLRRLLEPWLDIELARPEFTVREHERQAHGLTIGPLRLTTRIDRVDETEAGLLILDYKTGNAHPGEWLSDRPDQPQLPLYAVLADPAPAGVLFALLRPGDGLALKGFADDANVFGKPSRMTLTLPDQIEDWRRVLTQLAEDFAAGESTVAPKCYPKTCQHCDQRILCRLDPTTLEDIGEEDPEPTYA